MVARRTPKQIRRRTRRSVSRSTKLPAWIQALGASRIFGRFRVTKERGRWYAVAPLRRRS